MHQQKTKSKEILIDLAGQIEQPTAKCAESLLKNSDTFVTKLNSYMDEKENLDELIGSNNIELMHNNHINHFKYMSSLASLYDPKSFVETVIWAIRTYVSHGFSEKYWGVMLPKCMEIVKTSLSEDDCDEILKIYNFIYSNFDDFLEISKTTPSFYENLGDTSGNV